MKVRNKDTHVVLGYITVNDASKGGAINAELVKKPRRGTQASTPAPRTQQPAKAARENISSEDLMRTDEINGGFLSWDQVANPANQDKIPDEKMNHSHRLELQQRREKKQYSMKKRLYVEQWIIVLESTKL